MEHIAITRLEQAAPGIVPVLPSLGGDPRKTLDWLTETRAKFAHARSHISDARARKLRLDRARLCAAV